ncbi:MAG: hypothetical protein ACUZ8E_05630 [Candidatus Anammoxibacter sp.]
MLFKNKISQLKQIKKNLNRFIGESALRHSNIIEDFITEDQLFERGIDGLGKSLGQYSPFTKQFKDTIAGRLGRNTRSDHITLRDTGDFHRSIKVKLQRDGIKIESDPIKEDTNLLTEFGEEILFLTEENLTEFRNVLLKDDLIRNIKAAL